MPPFQGSGILILMISIIILALQAFPHSSHLVTAHTQQMLQNRIKLLPIFVPINYSLSVPRGADRQLAGRLR